MTHLSSIEIIIKEGNKAFKVILSGEAFKDLEDMKTKLGAKSAIEAVVYAIKILSSGLEEITNGKHTVELPNGKKVEMTFSSD